MSSKSKIKGSNFEREVVKLAKTYGLKAERAYASNGKALGESEEVDIKLEEFRIQCKRRKKIASFLQIPEGCELVAFREDNGNTLILMNLEQLMKFLHEREYGKLPKRIKKEQLLSQQDPETPGISNAKGSRSHEKGLD